MSLTTSDIAADLHRDLNATEQAFVGELYRFVRGNLRYVSTKKLAEYFEKAALADIENGYTDSAATRMNDAIAAMQIDNAIED